MGKTKESRNRKRKPNRVTKESSSSKLPKNDNHIDEMIELDERTDDASVIFSHFPEEIWLMITDKVEDSDSLTNLTQASPVFRNLLLARRVEFLFPQVWKVLGIKFEKREEEVYSYDFDGYAPWFSRILTFRLVCKRWCRGVDGFYENLSDEKHYKMWAHGENEFSMHVHPSGKMMGEWIDIVNRLDTNERIEEFIEHFNTTHFETGNHRAPLIGRHILIFYGLHGPESEISSLLSKYGQHFWVCQIHWADLFQIRFACYSDLKKMLKLMPNLKTLKVTYCGKQLNGSCRIDFGNLYLSRSEIRQLIQDNASEPIPKLHQLDFLSLTNFSPFLCNALISANNNISMLEVQRGNVQKGDDIYTFPMPNLKQLSIEYFSETEFENLYKPDVNWPLEKLYLNFKTCPFMPWSHIFTLLENKWSTTLKNVAIHFPPMQGAYSNDTNVIDDGSSTKLNLPNVQRFKLTSQEMFSLDFILPMKSLELLEISVGEKTIDEVIEKQLRLLEKNQVVQFVGYFQRFTESNIWNLFPKLKKIRFVDNNNRNLYTYNREKYGSQRRPCAARKPIRRIPKENLWLIRPPHMQVPYLWLNRDED